MNKGSDFSSLDQLVSWFCDAELAQLLAALESSLYGEGAESWSGAALGRCATRLTGRGDSPRAATDRLELYPESA